MTARDERIKAAAKAAMSQCKYELVTQPEGSEDWEWARIGYNDCARELGLPDFEQLA